MTLRARIHVSGQGINLVGRQFDGVNRKIDRVGRTGSRVGRVLSTRFGGASAAASKLRNVIAAVGVVAAARKVLGFNEALAQLQVDADMSVTEIRGLKRQILEVAKATGTMPDQLSAGMRVFQDFGGQLKFGRDMMEDLAKFAYDTNAPMNDAAKLAATLRKNLGIKTKGGVLDALVKLNELGKAGNLSLAEMAADLPKAFGSGKGSGYKGARGVQQIGAMMQIVGGQKGSSAEAQTAINRMLNDLTRRAKRIKKKTGFNIYDEKGDLKNFEVIAAALLKGTKGLKSKMLNELGLSGFSAMTLGAFSSNTNKAALSESAKKMFAVGANKDRRDIDRMFKAKTESGPGKSAAAVRKGTASLSAGLQDYGGKAIGFASENPGTAAGLAVGGYAALKILPALGRMLISRRGGGGLGAAAGAVGGVQKVFVVNMGGGMGGAAGTSAGGGAMKWVLGAGAAAAVGYGIGTVLDRSLGLSDKISSQLVEGKKARARARVEAATPEIIATNLAKTAQQFQQLARSGVGSVGTRGGGKVALTQENAMALLQAQATRSGGKDAFAAMKPLLESMLAELKKGQKVEVIAPGIDRPDVRSSRGPAQ